MGFFRKIGSSKPKKLAPATKEREAITRMHSDAQTIEDKAYDDYLHRRITYGQFKTKVAKAQRIRRGY